MRILPEDPRLIEFALGELDPKEYAAFAAALEAEENADARAAADDLRGLVRAAQRTFDKDAADMPLGLSEIQRGVILECAAATECESARRRLTRSPRRLAWLRLAFGFGVAAVLGAVLFAAGLGGLRETVPSGAALPEMANVASNASDAPRPYGEDIACEMSAENADGDAANSMDAAGAALQAPPAPAAPAPLAESLPEETLERLKALGYLGEEPSRQADAVSPEPPSGIAPSAAPPLPAPSEEKSAHREMEQTHSNSDNAAVALPYAAAQKKDESSVSAPVILASAEEMGPLKIDVPEPFFGGTPVDYWSPNLEPENYKERPELMVPAGTALLSRGKPVTASAAPFLGELAQITDGDKDYAKTSRVELGAGVQWVQIDLEQEYILYAVVLWHFHEGKRVYFDVVIQASGTPGFSDNPATVYNNDYDNSSGFGAGGDKEYIENNKGRLISLPEGVTARYLRLYSNGNTNDEKNHYVEVEAYGIPVR